ncbi:PadR family transcriptional regulator [Nonomuraea terrae]|uniref:PadR family transcriptional regulator n=1 Tax=Nonomuraea terrae TaxID=2530383 RepID=A0A4R4Y1I9_9ACTN|nr:PadR family transcriptional regulator [Nonomuraea terrae]TDD37955.1 PadR family transcriptional regulator [Nonomuraea terrae]
MSRNSRSFYDLIEAFETGVALFSSAGSCSIERALDTLLAREFIEVAGVEAGDRGRKVYRVTDAGRAEFRAWMTGEPAGPDLETAALSRLSFLGLPAPAERLPVLHRTVARIGTGLTALPALDEHLDALDIPEKHRDLAAHRRATLDHGIASQRFMLDRFGDHIDRYEPPDHGHRTTRCPAETVACRSRTAKASGHAPQVLRVCMASVSLRARSWSRPLAWSR